MRCARSRGYSCSLDRSVHVAPTLGAICQMTWRAVVVASCMLALAQGVRPRAADASQDMQMTLEELALATGTNRAHDDQKYVDLYAALFDPIRSTVRNVTEIGIATGQGVAMWHRYFPNARGRCRF